MVSFTELHVSHTDCSEYIGTFILWTPNYLSLLLFVWLSYTFEFEHIFPYLSDSGLEILQEIQLSNTRKNAFTDVAMKKILDSNLSAKYALTGHLGKWTMLL